MLFRSVSQSRYERKRNQDGTETEHYKEELKSTLENKENKSFLSSSSRSDNDDEKKIIDSESSNAPTLSAIGNNSPPVAARPPSVEEVEEYMLELGVFPEQAKKEAAKFWTHNQARGWVTGKVILKGQLTDSRQYEQRAEFYWEERDTIALNWHALGEYIVEYFAYPADLTLSTDDSYEFEVDTEALEAIPLYAAAQVLLNENNVVGDRLMNEFNVLLANLNPKIANGANFVANSLFQGTHNKLF